MFQETVAKVFSKQLFSVFGKSSEKNFSNVKFLSASQKKAWRHACTSCCLATVPANTVGSVKSKKGAPSPD